MHLPFCASSGKHSTKTRGATKHKSTAFQTGKINTTNLRLREQKPLWLSLYIDLLYHMVIFHCRFRKEWNNYAIIWSSFCLPTCAGGSEVWVSYNVASLELVGGQRLAHFSRLDACWHGYESYHYITHILRTPLKLSLLYKLAKISYKVCCWVV